MGAPVGKILCRLVIERNTGDASSRWLVSGWQRAREVHTMNTPRPRGSRRFAIGLLAFVMVVSGLGSAFIPSSARIAHAKNGDVLGDTLILAGPGGQYGILTVAPAGSVVSVDGDPVDGYYPVTFEGISGWTAVGLIQV
jgi:hypothetical protein